MVWLVRIASLAPAGRCGNTTLNACCDSYGFGHFALQCKLHNHTENMNFEVVMFIFTFTFTFSHLADAFIQIDLQMRTKEAIKSTKEQQYASAMTSLG